jgi:hypothetical protein
VRPLPPARNEPPQQQQDDDDSNNEEASEGKHMAGRARRGEDIHKCGPRNYDKQDCGDNDLYDCPAHPFKFYTDLAAMLILPLAHRVR